jgi:hypothetical protein
MTKNLNEIAKESNLDSADELAIYFASYRHTEILGHSVIISVCHDGDTSFTVDGACEIDNIPVAVGACIFRWLLKAWQEILQEIEPSILCFCYPTETDGALSRRLKAFEKVGFILSNDKMEFKR